MNIKKLEIVLVDSMSTDQTREAMNLFKKENNEFENVLIRENPKKNAGFRLECCDRIF